MISNLLNKVNDVTGPYELPPLTFEMIFSKLWPIILVIVVVIGGLIIIKSYVKKKSKNNKKINLEKVIKETKETKDGEE